MSQDTVFATTLVLADGLGCHLRPAALLARLAHMFDADIIAENGERSVSAKSMLGIVSLCASGGKHLRVTARGHDAQDAIAAIRAGFPSSAQSCGPETESAPCAEAPGCAKARRRRARPAA